MAPWSGFLMLLFAWDYYRVFFYGFGGNVSGWERVFPFATFMTESEFLSLAWRQTNSGAFMIFFPEDAHLSLISSGLIRKVVVKIAVNQG